MTTHNFSRQATGYRLRRTLESPMGEAVGLILCLYLLGYLF